MLVEKTKTKLNSNEILKLACKKGYTVNSLGEVFGPTGKKLKLRLMDTGYYVFRIKVCSYRIGWIRVSRFVAYCKYGECLFAPKIVVRHINSIRTDNSWDNIEIGTQQQNCFDKPEKDRISCAKNAALHTRRLSNANLQAFWVDRRTGFSAALLAKKYSLAKSTVRQILHGNTYKDEFLKYGVPMVALPRWPKNKIVDQLLTSC